MNLLFSVGRKMTFCYWYVFCAKCIQLQYGVEILSVCPSFTEFSVPNCCKNADENSGGPIILTLFGAFSSVYVAPVACTAQAALRCAVNRTFIVFMQKSYSKILPVHLTSSYTVSNVGRRIPVVVM
jgi:hypothetical protein